MTTTASGSANAGERTTWIDYYGPWALVPGGSVGIGASFARLLAADGINIVLAARRMPHAADDGTRAPTRSPNWSEHAIRRG